MHILSVKLDILAWWSVGLTQFWSLAPQQTFWMVVTFSQPGLPTSVTTTAEEVLLYESWRTRHGRIIRGQLGSKQVLKLDQFQGKIEFQIVCCSENNFFFKCSKKLDIIERKPQQAHLGWLHYDIGGRLGDVYGLHLLPLFFKCLSCTKKRQIDI